MTETAVKDETKTRSLPDVGEYELQIDSIRVGDNKFNEGKKDYHIRMMLVGTQNPDYEDEPYVVTLFVGVPNWMKGEANGQPFMSNFARLLESMGYEIPKYTKGSDVNTEELVGLYARGLVTLNKDKTYPRITAKGLMPVTNEQHVKVNQDAQKRIFKPQV